MIARVVLYSKLDDEKPANYTLDVRDLDQAYACVPQCLANHKFHCGADCHLTHWTVSSSPAPGKLMRINATGVFDDERPA